jgi:hypothetical protein
MKRKFLAAALAVALSGAMAVCPAEADELSDLYAQVLQDPGNSALNLRYAALAEMKGEYRLALAAYERVLLNDPDNQQAKIGLARMLRLLQPATTRVALTVGTGYESNPANTPSPTKGRAVLFGSLGIRDDRKIGDTPWRSDVLAMGNFVIGDGTLNYGYLGGNTGPVFDLTPDWALHLAGGVAGAVFDRRPYYGEIDGLIAIDGRFGAERQSIQIRGGWRDYDHFFTASSGGYVYVADQIAVPVAAASGLIVVTPFLQYSDIKGAYQPTPTTEVDPGRYTDYGGDLGYYQNVSADVILGGDIVIRHRAYRDKIAGQQHTEDYVAPGANLTVKNVLPGQTDLRFDYRYRHDASNDPLRRYVDHLLTVSFSKRF